MSFHRCSRREILTLMCKMAFNEFYTPNTTKNEFHLIRKNTFQFPMAFLEALGCLYSKGTAKDRMTVLDPGTKDLPYCKEWLPKFGGNKRLLCILDTG
jgi:hypothetical protein